MNFLDQDLYDYYNNHRKYQKKCHAQDQLKDYVSVFSAHFKLIMWLNSSIYGMLGNHGN
jgi:hypothetical protein